MASDPPKWNLDTIEDMVEVDPSPPRTEVGELPSSARRKASKRNERELPNFVGMEGRRFGSEPSSDRSLMMRKRT